MALRRIHFKEWFEGLNLVGKFAFALAFAVLVGVLAQVRVPLPFTPVPLTLQVMGVPGAGLLMGSVWGGLSMAMYVVLGALGLHWFAGHGGGVGYLLGPTGGYLLGFVASAYLTGIASDWLSGVKGLFIGAIVGILVIYYTCGVVGLMLWGMGFAQAIQSGVVPFVAFDLIKAILTATLAAVVR